jgi:integrase/recombinase XerD
LFRFEEAIMTEILSSTKALDPWIAAWLTHQRALGREYGGEQWVLGHLRRFIASIRASDLDLAGFNLWCDSYRHLTATTRRTRQLIVRKFCLYRQRTEPDCFVPNPLYFVRSCPYRRPVIIEPEQVARLLVAADNLAPTPNSPLRPAVMRLAIVILYTAGLRRGELVRLTLDDVEPQTGLLRIRVSKFHKSRLVPLSPDASDALRAYLCQRLASPFDADQKAPLLCSDARGRRRYTGAGLAQAINHLFDIAEVLDSEGRRPRVHDMRHSFAVQALLRWYRAGADVQSNLPRLAMYMGHVSIVSTAHYLHFVPTMRELASDRFEAAFGDLVEELPA